MCPGQGQRAVCVRCSLITSDFDDSVMLNCCPQSACMVNGFGGEGPIRGSERYTDASPGLHRVPLGLQVALDAADGGLDGGVEDARPALRLRPQLLRQALCLRPLRPLLVGQRCRRLCSGP